MSQKKILIIAGPNGAGKTTFAREFLPDDAECPVFVNADMIAERFVADRPEIAAWKAARTMLAEITEHAENGDNFAFETTLSGRGYVRLIRAWRAQGYHVKLFFLALHSPEESIKRVATRVRQGGHFVPDEVVRRRFAAGLRNFNSIYRFEVDLWHWYDNSGESPVLLEEGQNS